MSIDVSFYADKTSGEAILSVTFFPIVGMGNYVWQDDMDENDIVYQDDYLKLTTQCI